MMTKPGVILTVGVVVLMGLIFFRRFTFALFGRTLEILVYWYILHCVIYGLALILNWLIKATYTPLLPTGGMTRPIAMSLFSLKKDTYYPEGIAWFERVCVVVIAYFTIKMRNKYKTSSGG